MIYSQLMIKNNADAFENLQVRLEFVHQTAAIFGDINLTENSLKRSPDDAALVSSTSGAGSNSGQQENGENRLLSEGNGLLIVFNICFIYFSKR